MTPIPRPPRSHLPDLPWPFMFCLRAATDLPCASVPVGRQATSTVAKRTSTPRTVTNPKTYRRLTPPRRLWATLGFKADRAKSGDTRCVGTGGGGAGDSRRHDELFQNTLLTGWLTSCSRGWKPRLLLKTGCVE